MAAVIAGIDFSTKAVDIVLLDEDSDAATWHRFELAGFDAFERARDVRGVMPHNVLDRATGVSWDDVLAIGIEDPRGYGAGSLYRMQGAILGCLPRTTLVRPWIPSAWRKTVGLAGNASKQDVWVWALRRMWDAGMTTDGEDYHADDWPEDATDAYAIATATRTLLQHGQAAA